MPYPRCTSRDKKIELLKRQIAILKQTNKNLSTQLRELLTHSTMAAGIKGEKLIIDIAQGTKAKKNAPHDIKLKDGSKVEVKYSRLTYPVNSSSSCRWVWNGILGERKEKDYDYLVLIGDKDNIYHKYEDDDSPYVYFLLRKKDVAQIIALGGRRGFIFLTILPHKTRSVCKNLWKFKKSATEMRKFFDQLVVVK